MKLRDLMRDADINNLPDIEIREITTDSRQVQKGDVFVAIKGEISDGHDYIHQAIAAGASAIIVDADYKIQKSEKDVAIIRSENSRASVARLAGLLWDDIPDIKLAVTGTNGKSSVAGFAAQLMELHQKPTLLLGTLGIFLNGQKIDDSLTTPSPIHLHKYLQWAKTQGAKAIALEASSHGLAQNRLDGLKFDVAGFTNLTRDHLDYHRSMDAYSAAKIRLFSERLKTDGLAVVNQDDQMSEAILTILKKRSIAAITYGQNAALSIKDIIARPQGQEVYFDHMGEKHHFLLPLIGRFQVENAACAALMVMGAGLGTQVFDDLSKLKAIRGRMEYIAETSNGGHIYVDYAHTPAGLETLLKHIRPHTENRLLVVFGAGGERDQGKRPLMGKAANDYADIQYITDDNPRGEDPAFIRSEIAKAAPNAINIDGRRQAIESAINDLKRGDVLVVAGKGHEDGQTIGGEILPFNDADVIRQIVGQ